MTGQSLEPWYASEVGQLHLNNPTHELLRFVAFGWLHRLPVYTDNSLYNRPLARVIDTAHIALVTYLVCYYAVSNDGRPEAMRVAVWQVAHSLQPAMSLPLSFTLRIRHRAILVR